MGSGLVAGRNFAGVRWKGWHRAILAGWRVAKKAVPRWMDIGYRLESGWHSLIAVDYTGLAKEWDVQGYLRASIQLDGDGLGVDWSPKGRLFAVTTGQDGSRLLLFDAQSGVLRWRRQDVLPNYTAPFGYGLDEVNGVRYSPSGRWIATAHQDGRIIVRFRHRLEIQYSLPNCTSRALEEQGGWPGRRKETG